MRLWIAAILLAWAGQPAIADDTSSAGDGAAQVAPEDPADWEELKTVTSGDITARFRGTRLKDRPLTFGVRELRFTFKDDPTPYLFEPKGALSGSDWSFDIFSPGGEYVLLLQDRFGPWHLIAVTDLRAYLKGDAEPAHVIGKKIAPGEPAAVHHDARWRSPFVLEYKVSCCGTSETREYNVRFPDYRAKQTEDTVTDYRPSLAGEVSALPEARTVNLNALISLLVAWNRKARQNPGEWQKGNVALGAEPEEYVPSDPELMVSEIGDRISHIVLHTDPTALTAHIEAEGIKMRKLVYERFTFRHVDVMGSGRFFYASPPQQAVVDIRTE